MNSPKDLHSALKYLENLPAIPCIAKKILSLKINTDEDERTLLELVEQDPPILARIIGLANSPHYGAGRKILKLHDAAAVLGSKRIKNIALSFAMMSSIKGKSAGLLNIHDLWKHSLSVAMTMDTLSHFMPQNLRPSDDEIYLAGLLHDIGFVVLDYLDTLLSDQLHARLMEQPGRPLAEIEAELLTMSHYELGAELGRRWCLPESIVAVLRYHHTPGATLSTAGQPLVRMACLAGKLLPAFINADSSQMSIAVAEWLELGIDPLKTDEIRAKAQDLARQVEELNA